MPTRKPVRHLTGQGWQVLAEVPPRWIDCLSQRDAELIAEAEAVCYGAIEGRLEGPAVAERLDDIAEAVRRNIGSGTLERFVRHTAERLRQSGS